MTTDAAREFQPSEEDYLRCLRCGLCSYSCPTYRVLLTQAQSPRGRVALMRTHDNGGWTDAGRGHGDGFAGSLYRCTLCGACTQACPAGVKLDALLLHARERMAEGDLLPPALSHLGRTLGRTHNLSGEDNSRRLLWTENLDRRPAGLDRQQAEVVYFVGCLGSLYPRSYSIPQAAVRTLDAAGVSYTLLGGGEWCCGFPLLSNGSRAAAHEAIRHNVERVRATGASQVVFTCPSCYHMWSSEYPPVAGAALDGLRLRHLSELLVDLIAERRLPLHAVDERVTYHDPCDLGRKGGVFEAPRQVLRSIPGLSLVEMRDSRDGALCCGGGGNLETFDPGLSRAASQRRLAQAVATGAGTIISACQQCVRTLATASRQQKLPMRVLDLTEMVWKAIA